MDGESDDEVLRLERLVAESGRQNTEILEATKRMTAKSGPISASSGVNIHSDGLVAMVVALVGAMLAGLAILCLVIAVAAVLVVAAWRDADMSQLQVVRDDMDMAAATIMTHERKITKLENPPNEPANR